jgi:ADP-ribose pyrophosphatase
MTKRERLSRVRWKRLTSRQVYKNRWVELREDQVELPDGNTTMYGVVRCGECVGILPFLDAETVLLVGQYRYVAGDFFWEMPTGGMHARETVEEAAQRELAEEAGFTAGHLTFLTSFHTSKSVMEETAHLFIAETLAPVGQVSADPTEFIEVRPFPFEEALRMVRDGRIKDAMTVIAVLLAARLKGK